MRAKEFISEAKAKNKPSGNPTGFHPKIDKMTINDVPKQFVDAFKERGITNPNTITAYFKISGKETGALGGPENLDYSGTPNKNIIKLFGEPNKRRGTKYSNPNNVNYMDPRKLDWLKSDPKRFAQFIYSGQQARIVPDGKQGYRMEFDTPELAQKAQDAWTYRGRAHVQITGRDQYARVSQELFGDDRLLKDPDLLNDPATGLRASAVYAKVYGKADKDASQNPTDSFNKALVSVGGSKAFAPGGRMYGKQVKRLNDFGKQLDGPNSKATIDQHYAGIDLSKPIALQQQPATQVAQAEPTFMDKLKTFGQGVSDVFFPPVQAGVEPNFAPGAQGLPSPSKTSQVPTKK